MTILDFTAFALFDSRYRNFHLNEV